jgi:hypothetical protein
MVEVGSQTPDGDGPIMFMLEASNFDVYAACPESRRSDPFTIGLNEHGQAIDFDEVVDGNA